MPARKSTRKTPQKPPSVSPARKWLFRSAALLLAPLFVLGLAESVLRLSGYGFDTAFWEKTQIAGKEYFVNNEDFSLRFFPPQLARWAHPVRIAAEKPTNTFRIFIMGESAAQGDPEPAFGAGRYLEVLLRERYPGMNFEVANVAFTAINSHVILPIARECAHHEGDLWIIYMGNNEMVGPFGAATVFGLKAPPLGLVRASLALQRLRLGQWIVNLARRAKSQDTTSSWGGMEMFMGNQLPASAPGRRVVYRNFESSLRDIVKAGIGAGARILLNTVAVNLRDCPPFASLPNPQLSPADREACDQRYAKGSNAQAQRLFTEAVADYEEAAAVDPSRADLQYHWAECLAALGNSAAASHYQIACDCDSLPFRADSRLNEIIRQTASALSCPNLVLCDSAGDFDKQPAPSNPFYEHVHFNFDGNYRLARIWADQAQRSFALKLPAEAAGDWASQEICERRLGLTDQYRCSIVEGVVGRMRQPPLSGQMNNAERIRSLEDQVRRWRQVMGPDAPMKAREICADAIGRAPDDYILREIFGVVLQGMGDFKASAEQWRAAGQLMPRDRFAFLSEGQALERTGDFEQARAALREAATLNPRWVDPWMELGKVDFFENKPDAAMDNYRRGLQIDPKNPRLCFYMGKALSKLSRSGESIEWFRRSVQSKPDFVDAHFALGGELGLQGKISDAKAEFEETVRLQPSYVPGHLNLGVSLLKLDQPEAARRQFAEALRLDPNNKFAQEYLTQTEALQRSRP
jgi:tetratricopeptide (TPR) repeat protein